MKREEFLDALRTVVNATTDKDDVLTGTDSFVFDGKFVRTYNNQMAFSYPLDTGLSCSVKARETLKIVEKMQGDALSLKQEKETLIIEDDRTVLKMRLEEGTDDILGALSGLELDALKWKTLPKDFFEGLSLCSFAMSADPVMAYINGVAVTGGAVWASDNYRISRYMFEKVFKGEFSLPKEAVFVLLKLAEKPKEYAAGNGWVNFRTPTGVVFSSNELYEPFPIERVGEILSESESEEGKAYKFPERMDRSLAMVKPFSEEDDRLAVPNVVIRRRAGRLEVHSEREFGEVSDFVEFEGEMFGEDISLRVSPDHLRSMLAVNREFRIVGEEMVLFLSPQFVHLMTVYVEEEGKK